MLSDLFDTKSDNGKRFLLESFEQEPKLFRASSSTTPILGIDALGEILVSTHLPYPYVRVVKEHETLRHPIDSSPVAPSRQSLCERTRWYLEKVREGCSLIMPAINRRSNLVAGLCSNLEEATSLIWQANAYLTPRSNRAFDIHFDTHDVFIWQQEGKKDWKVYGAEICNPDYHQRFLVDKAKRDELLSKGPILDITLSAGDLLYIPRGFLHSGVSSEEDSLHLTLGLFRRTPLDELIFRFGAAADDDDLMSLIEEELDPQNPNLESIVHKII